jgi:hypothetical protein
MAEMFQTGPMQEEDGEVMYGQELLLQEIPLKLRIFG